MSKVAVKASEVASEEIKEIIVQEAPAVTAKVAEVVKKRWIQFINGRDPGVTLEFHYHSATHPLKHYKLFHGKEHELPEEIIDHLENIGEARYEHRKNEYGEVKPTQVGMKYLFRCQNVKRLG